MFLKTDYSATEEGDNLKKKNLSINFSLEVLIRYLSLIIYFKINRKPQKGFVA